MAHSPYSEMAIGYVSRNQGCCKFDLARFLTSDPRRCPSKQYYLVNTQIRLGNLIAIFEGSRYYLYTNNVNGHNAMRASQ